MQLWENAEIGKWCDILFPSFELNLCKKMRPCYHCVLLENRKQSFGKLAFYKTERLFFTIFVRPAIWQFKFSSSPLVSVSAGYIWSRLAS